MFVTIIQAIIVITTIVLLVEFLDRICFEITGDGIPELPTIALFTVGTGSVLLAIVRGQYTTSILAMLFLITTIMILNKNT